MDFSKLSFPCALTLKIIPGASKNEIVGVMENGVWKIRIAAAPEKGKANKELIAFLEKITGRKVEILSGHHQPLKRVKISG